MSVAVLSSLPLVDTLARDGPSYLVHRVHHAFLHRLQIDLDRPYIPLLAVLESLAGAACYAASSVLQHQAASAQPPEASLRPGLLLSLARSGRWMVGNVLDLGGFVFQFLALRRASLALVEPIFVLSLVFSIAGAAMAKRRRPSAEELASSSLVVVGLIVFLAVARPGRGHPRASTIGWLVLFAATTVIVGGLVLLAKRQQRWRPLLLGVGAGVIFAVTASLTERTGHLLDRGVLQVLASWSPYTLAALGILGLLLNQSAYQAGDLRMSLPAIAVAEPLVAIIIAQALFGEHIDHSALAVVGELLGLLLMVVGVIRLGRHQAPAADTAAPSQPSYT
jgi:drug/metabolite transporter (DMT)-like permease